MSHSTRTKPRYSMNLPGTFEVHDADGYWYGTSADFKAAEALADRLNIEDPEGHYDWMQVPAQTETRP